MIKINLANYRERECSQRKKRLFILLTISVSFALVLNLFLYFYYQALDMKQLARNQFLQEQVSILDNKLDPVNKFEGLLNNYKSRLSHYNEISNYSNNVVSLLTILNTITPNQVYYQSISFNLGVLHLQGFAKSPLYLSLLMDNLSQKYTDVKLTNSNLDSNNLINFDVIAKNKALVNEHE